MNHLPPRLWGRITAVALTTLAFAAPAHAFIVFDPSNFVENSLTAARSLEQITNQIRQLENQAQMLANQALNLASLPFSIVSQLRTTLASTNRLIAEARGMTFDLERTQNEFAWDYPEAYGSGTSGAWMAADALARWRNSIEALQTTVSLQAQAAQNLGSDESALTELVNQSQNALGALQALQATNQLLALHARQLIQAQQLQLTQGRSTALEEARRVAAEARAREVRRRFLGSGVQYTPQSVDMYGF